MMSSGKKHHYYWKSEYDKAYKIHYLIRLILPYPTYHHRCFREYLHCLLSPSVPLQHYMCHIYNRESRTSLDSTLLISYQHIIH